MGYQGVCLWGRKTQFIVVSHVDNLYILWYLDAKGEMAPICGPHPNLSWG